MKINKKIIYFLIIVILAYYIYTKFVIKEGFSINVPTIKVPKISIPWLNNDVTFDPSNGTRCSVDFGGGFTATRLQGSSNGLGCQNAYNGCYGTNQCGNQQKNPSNWQNSCGDKDYGCCGCEKALKQCNTYNTEFKPWWQKFSSKWNSTCKEKGAAGADFACTDTPTCYTPSYTKWCGQAASVQGHSACTSNCNGARCEGGDDCHTGCKCALGPSGYKYCIPGDGATGLDCSKSSNWCKCGCLSHPSWSKAGKETCLISCGMGKAAALALLASA